MKTINANFIQAIFLIITFFVFGVQNCYAEIIKANNFSILKNKVIRLASKHSLVLFDVDDVLIAPTN